MSEFYNATDASRIIGISYKTILRRLEDGKIEAVKGEDGQYSIADAEVERLRILQFTRPRPVKSIGVQSSQDQSILERLADLEERVRSLESRTSQDRTPEQPHMPLYTTPVDREEAHTPQPQIRTTSPKNALPEGCILASEFAKLHGVARETFRDHYTLGIGPDKEKPDVSERLKTGREKYGTKERYLTTKQQQEAIAFWIRHNVKFSM